MTSTHTEQRVDRKGVDTAQIEMVLSQIESLPTLPAVATRLLEMTTANRSSVREVAELVGSDQSLSARVLSMASRADVGETVQTIERAVQLLGLPAIRSLVLSIQVFETFSQRTESPSNRFDRAGFWKHSMAVACAGRLLSQIQVNRPYHTPASASLPEEIFICGLLHDVGKVVLNACFPKSYDRVIARVEAVRAGITDVEREVFGLDHTVAGQRLASHWKLPDMVQESIWLHHHNAASTPKNIHYPKHVHWVQVANQLAQQMRIGYSGDYSVERSIGAIAESAGVPRELLEKASAALPEMIEKRAELIGLDHLTSREVYYEALAKTNAEVTRINMTLAMANRQLEQRSVCFEALRALNLDLTEEATHEDVCRVGVSATRRVVETSEPVAVFCRSACRQIAIAAVEGEQIEATRPEVVPLSAAGNLSSLDDLRSKWSPVGVLPESWCDRLGAMMGQSPSWCWPIRHNQRFLGVIVIADDPPAENHEAISALSDALGARLAAAESRMESRQLTEELADMNRRLIDSQGELTRIRSVAMVGEMAAGAAHELNNPLAVISGRAQILNKDAFDEDVRRSAELIAEHAHRASAIVSELMEFAKPAPPEPTRFSLIELLSEIRQEWLSQSELAEKDFQLEVSDATPEIHADRSQIKRLFDEVIRNAIEAMRDEPNPLLLINYQADLTDDMVVIGVRDNGCGMPPSVMERAMDPFFSHQPAGRKRGLGLSRAARYAEINGGRVRLSGSQDKGTLVMIELPIATRP